MLVIACARSIAAVYILPMAASDRFSLSIDLIHLGGLVIMVILCALPRNRIGAVNIVLEETYVDLETAIELGIDRLDLEDQFER